MTLMRKHKKLDKRGWPGAALYDDMNVLYKVDHLAGNR